MNKMMKLRTKITYRLYGLRLFRPLAQARHRNLCATSERINNHTYTCFYRSPAQLEAFFKALDRLNLHSDKAIAINVFAGSNGSEAYTLASEILFRREDLDFHILASDLHQEMVDKASSAIYSYEEVTQGMDVDPAFIERTFDRVDGKLRVKPAIQDKVSFKQADLLDDNVIQNYPKADVVTAQNVFFHMRPDMARSAFASVIKTLKPNAVLMIDGMDLDLRLELTEEAGLEPHNYKLKEIHQYARRHVPKNWWDFYFGAEPFSTFKLNKIRRYATIFLKTDN